MPPSIEPTPHYRFPMRLRRFAVFVTSAAVCFAIHVSAAPHALAGEPDLIERKARADAAFDSRSYADALEGYRAVLSRGGDPRIHYNIAQALTALERYPEALASYQSFIAEAPAGTLSSAQQEKLLSLVDELKSKISRLTVRCVVPGALVLVRGKEIGSTPLSAAVSLNAGPAKVEVVAEGYKPFGVDMVLAGGRTATVDVVLERLDFTGALVIASSAPGSHIFVDGIERGLAPMTLRLDRGAHVVLSQATGYVEQSATAMIESGAQREMRFTLPRAPDYTLALVGGGVGLAGIAMGATTGVLAFTTFSSAKGQCDTTTKSCGPAGQSDLQSSKTYGALSTAGFIVGAAGVGLGVYGWIRARQGTAFAKPVEVVVTPGGLRLVGQF